MINSLQQPGQKPSLPRTLEGALDAINVPIPTAALRAIAAAALRDREVTPQGLGRVAAYEQESFRRRREGAPRFSWVLQTDGVAATPRIWARGGWRLSRRILTEDAVGNWTVTLAIYLAVQMAEGDDRTREILGKAAIEAAAGVLGPLAVYGQGSRQEWGELRGRLAPHQHPMGPEAPTAEQTAAAAELEAQDLSPYNLFFGVRDTALLPSEDLPTRLRLARPGEGLPFDTLVASKAGGDQVLARDVLAYVQEWGWLVDRLGRSPSFEEYAERWEVDLATVRARNNRFAVLFPSEETPERIWNLLWSGATESFVRLIGREVTEEEGSPTVINRFISALAFELRGAPALGQDVLAAIAAFEEHGASDPGRELRRFFALGERSRIWSVQALVLAGEPTSAEGLLSLESVIDQDSAGYVEHELGRHRRELPEGAARELLLAAQKALRVSSTLDALDPPRDTTSYLQGVEWAARALARSQSPELDRIDLVAEAKATVRALEAVH